MARPPTQRSVAFPARPLSLHGKAARLATGGTAASPWRRNPVDVLPNLRRNAELNAPLLAFVGTPHPSCRSAGDVAAIAVADVGRGGIPFELAAMAVMADVAVAQCVDDLADGVKVTMARKQPARRM